MTEPLIDVDKVVREVLAALGAAPVVAGTRRVPSAEQLKNVADGTRRVPATFQAVNAYADPPPPARQRREAVTAVAPGERDGVLAVGGQVVTMAALEGRLGGIKRVVVPAGSVVTPSVRDELQRKKVALVCARAEAAAPAGGARLVVMVLGSRYDPGLLVRALKEEGIAVDTRRADCLIAATDQLAGEVRRPGTLALVLSRYPAIALCLANRHRGVRAVWGVDAATAASAAASVGANVLVIDPQTVGSFQLRQMVGRFCEEGPQECPESIRERLG